MRLVQRLFLPVCVRVRAYIFNSACVGIPWDGCRPTHAKAHTTPSMYREESSDLIDKIECQELLDTCINTHTHTYTNTNIQIHAYTYTSSVTNSGSSAMTAQACAWTYTHTHAYRKAFHCTYPYLYYDSDVSISMCVSRYDSDVTKSNLWRAVTVPHTLTLSHTHVTHSVTWGIHVCATTHSYDIDHSLVVCYTRRARSFIHVRRNSSISRISSSQMPTTRVSFLRVFFFPLVFFKDKTSIALLSRGRRRISQTLGHQYPRNLTIT